MEQKKKVLWISLNAPYDKVDHAGGQVHNYYLKKLNESGKTDIKLISFCHPSELSKLDLDQYGIDATIFPQENKGIKHLLWGVVHLETRYNPWNRYAGITYNFVEIKIRRIVSELLSKGYSPDVIILQWTQIVLLIHYLKKCFPKSKFVCIEEDVTYLGLERSLKMKPSWMKKMRASKMKRIEVAALNAADQIICSNKKDIKLLDKEKINTRRWSWCPYYNTMSDVNRKQLNSDVLFFGAMNREANWRSAIWFIENVFNKIENLTQRLIILGSNPPHELLKYKNERILIPGYVEDVKPFFANSLCLVVPLQLGAGIKIKVLEGMSSGIPVLANNIGIEGIPAENMKEYIYCESPDDFRNALSFILANPEKAKEIGEKGRKFVCSKFNYANDTEKFINLISEL